MTDKVDLSIGQKFFGYLKECVAESFHLFLYECTLESIVYVYSSNVFVL